MVFNAGAFIYRNGGEKIIVINMKIHLQLFAEHGKSCLNITN